MSEKDNVAVALEDIPEGKVVELNNRKIDITQNIDFGHKFAIKDIQEGENIVKYGEIIGVAASDIKTGQHVHVHNVKSLRGGINSKS